MKTLNNENNWKKENVFPFYYFLLSIYPAIFALGHNIHEIYINVAVRPIAILFLICLVVFGVIFILTRSLFRTGLLSTWIMILFLNYGKFFDWLDQISFFDLISRHRYVIFLWLLTSVVGIHWISKIKPSKNLTIILNLFSIALIIIPVIQITSYSLRIENQRNNAESIAVNTDVLTANADNPDVYVIVLDTYPRADSLEKNFDINNEFFLQQLTDMGFYVASCARCNYAYTELSLSSMFNLNYLDQVAPDVINSGKDTVPLFNLLKNSLMRRNFEQLGYSTYSLASYPPLAWDDSDFFYDVKAEQNENTNGNLAITSFERLIFDSTAIKLLFDLDVFVDSTDQVPFNYRYAEHVRYHQFTLQMLRNVVSQRGPKLVFTHLTSPHAPFVFTPEGELLTEPPNIPWVDGLSWEDNKKYFGMQVQYISNQMTPILKEIINGSETDPIIVLFGDHGYALNDAERMAVLSAVYAPEYVKESLYPSISHVNIFRVIFNQAFGGNYDILEDVSYMSPHPDPFNFSIIDEVLPGCVE